MESRRKQKKEKKKITDLIRNIDHGNWAVVKDSLSQKEIKVDYINHISPESDSSALSSASVQGHLETVQALLTLGADVNHSSEGEDSPLIYAIEKSHWQVADLLLENKADVNHDGRAGKSALISASCQSGSLSIVEKLITQGAKTNAIDDHDKTPLIHAINHQNWDVANLLIEHKVNLNQMTKEGETALTRAVLYRNMDMVKALLRNGADVNYARIGKDSPLTKATRFKYWNIAALLLQHKANVTHVGMLGGLTSLHCAASGGCLEIVKMLVIRGANIHLESKYFETPFYLAINYHRWEVVEFFLACTMIIRFFNFYQTLLAYDQKGSKQSDKVNTLFIALTALQASLLRSINNEEQKEVLSKNLALKEKVSNDLAKLNSYQYQEAIYYSLNDHKTNFYQAHNHEQEHQITNIIVDYLFIAPIPRYKKIEHKTPAENLDVYKPKKNTMNHTDVKRDAAPHVGHVSRADNINENKTIYRIGFFHMRQYGNDNKKRDSVCKELMKRCTIL